MSQESSKTQHAGVPGPPMQLCSTEEEEGLGAVNSDAARVGLLAPHCCLDVSAHAIMLALAVARLPVVPAAWDTHVGHPHLLVGTPAAQQWAALT